MLILPATVDLPIAERMNCIILITNQFEFQFQFHFIFCLEFAFFSQYQDMLWFTDRLDKSTVLKVQPMYQEAKL